MCLFAFCIYDCLCVCEFICFCFHAFAYSFTFFLHLYAWIFFFFFVCMFLYFIQHFFLCLLIYIFIYSFIDLFVWLLVSSFALFTDSHIFYWFVPLLTCLFVYQFIYFYLIFIAFLHLQFPHASVSVFRVQHWFFSYSLPSFEHCFHFLTDHMFTHSHSSFLYDLWIYCSIGFIILLIAPSVSSCCSIFLYLRNHSTITMDRKEWEDVVSVTEAATFLYYRISRRTSCVSPELMVFLIGGCFSGSCMCFSLTFLVFFRELEYLCACFV